MEPFWFLQHSCIKAVPVDFPLTSWQATFETELQGYLAQLLEMDQRNILVRARRKNAKVTWHEDEDPGVFG